MHTGLPQAICPAPAHSCGSPADFAAFIQSESGKWARLVKERGIKIE